MTARLLRWLTLVELCVMAAWALGLYRVANWPLGWSIVAAACIPLLTHGWIIGLQSIAGAWWRRRTAADGGGAWNAIRAWLVESWISLRTFRVDVPWRAGQALPQGDDPARIPVLLVHGHLCNRGVWRSMAGWLAERGHAIEALDMEPPFADIDRYAPQIEAAAARLLNRTGAPTLAVIGHSLGTMAIRAWARQYGHGPIAAFVSLGGPHQGTWIAKFAHTAGAVQLRPASQWIADLAASETTQFRRLTTVILSLHDNVIMPQVTQTLPDARTIVVRGIGHLELLHHRSIRPLVAQALDAATGHDRTGTPP